MNKSTNPYVGPRSFEDGEKLYGRDRELRSLSALLIAERIVLLHSPSGAGKSSLVKAGLLPRMRAEKFNVLPVARVNLETPTDLGKINRYAFSVMTSMEEKYPPDQRLPAATLAGLTLDGYLSQRAPEKDTLLVLDQFEEVLTLAANDRDGKLEFFNQLGDALANETRWALFSMREDYLGMLVPYQRPIPNRLNTRFRLDLLTSESALPAIQNPAKDMGWEFKTESAIKLADDLSRVMVTLPNGEVVPQPGQYIEPVQLQVVCYRLWENLKKKDKVIDDGDLKDVGDVNTSLAMYYASSVEKAALDGKVPERSLREWFDRKLISQEKLRNQVRMGVDDSDGMPTSVVSELIDKHLLRVEQRNNQSWVELSHDRLVEPVRKDNIKWFEANLSLFQRQAEMWEQKSHSESLLLRGTDLDQAELDIKTFKLTPAEEEYLKACRQLRSRIKRDRFQRRMITVGLVASVAMFIVAVYFAIQAINKEAKAVAAASQAEAASADSIQSLEIAQTASAKSAESLQVAQTAQVRADTERATAVSSRNDAYIAKATAEAAKLDAEKEKANALEQKKIAESKSLEAENEKRSAEASQLVAQSLLQQLRAKDQLANLLAVEAFRTEDNSRTRLQMIAPLYSRGRLTLTIRPLSNPRPVLGDIAYTSDGLALVASYFDGCPKGNLFTCETGQVRTWVFNPGPPLTLQQNNKVIDPPGLMDANILFPKSRKVLTAACMINKANLRQCLTEDFQVWDLDGGTTLGSTLSLPGIVAADKPVRLAISPDEKTLAVILYTIPANKPADSLANLVLIDLQSFAQIGETLPQPNGLSALTFSPDGKSLALVSDNIVNLLDLASMQLSEVAGTKSTIKLLSLAFSPDGSLLATGADDGRISLVDLQTGLVDNRLMYAVSRVLQLAFSPDGKVLASGSQDKGLVLWDVPSRQRLIGSTIYMHNEPQDIYPLTGLTFSPDGAQLASISNEIILWAMSPEAWVTQACLLAGRNFSQAEWNQFFPGIAYRSTCPMFKAGQ